MWFDRIDICPKIFFGSLFVVCLITAGCTLNRNNIADDFSVEHEAAQGEYQVRMEFNLSEPQMHRGTIQQPMTVQDVLVESKAIKKYRNMEISILRQLPDKPRPIRMDVDFQASQRKVVDAQNYAIHPGDRILIRPKDDTLIGNLLNKAMGSKK